jgi:hypothetical protein
LVSDIKAEKQTEDVGEQCVEENTLTEERRSDGRLERTAQRGASELVVFAKYN